MEIVFAQATEPEDRIAVYRFRYEIHVEELERRSCFADHANRLLTDPLDEFGHVVVAKCDDKIIGTQRLNMASDGDLAEWVDFFQMRRLGHFYPKNVSFSSRLMVAAPFRSSALLWRLGLKCYQIGNSAGTCFDFLYCRPSLANLYQKFGYTPFGEPRLERDAGEVIPMVLAGHDYKHLSKIRSPFLRATDQKECTRCCVRFVEQSGILALNSSLSCAD